MCGLDKALMGVGTLLSGFGAISDGQAQKRQAYADAAAAAANGRLEAERIRKEAAKARGAAQVASAENGLDVNRGVSAVIDASIVHDSEYDAAMAVINGGRAADRLRVSGDNAARRGAMGGAMTVLQGGADLYSGWKAGKIKGGG